jgi:hypothetical protein
MTIPLRLTLKPATDGTGELSAKVHVNGFSGIGVAWFNIAEIAAYGATLANTYPLLPEQTYDLKGGYWNSAVRIELEHVHLGLHFYPVGLLGEIGCRVHLAAQLESASGAPEYAVTVELRTHYEELRAFGASLVALAEGKSDEAILSCSGA